MNIRRADESDLKDIIAMYELLYSQLQSQGMPYELDPEQTFSSLTTQIRSKLFCILIAEDDSQNKLGFLSSSVSRIDRKLRGGLVGVINDVYLYPAGRGGGTASALLSEAEAWMRESGAQSAKCDVVVGNDEGLRFWHRHGYADVSISIHKSL